MPRCILYLEPPTSLYLTIKEYLETSREVFGPTEASQYPPHCSMTGFFNLRNTDRFVEEIDKLIADRNFERPMIGNVQLIDRCVQIKVIADDYRAFALELKEQTQVELRLKPVDHISLAYVHSFYFDCQTKSFSRFKKTAAENEIDQDTRLGWFFYDCQEHFELAQSVDFVDDGGNWSFCLYEQIDATDVK